MTFSSRLPFASLAACSLLGCVEPLQNGGVTIVGDPAERLGTLCRFRHREGAAETFCAPDAPEQAEAPARVRRIAAAGDAMKGPSAAGREGDWLLEGSEIAVVIGDIGGPPATRGLVLDAGGARGRSDALASFTVDLGAPHGSPVYDAITSGVEADGTAWIDVVGRTGGATDASNGDAAGTSAAGSPPAGAAGSPDTQSLRVHTRYALAPSSRALAITTTVLGASSGASVALDLGDRICWGSATPAFGTDGSKTTAPYVFGLGEGVGYAVAVDGRPFTASPADACSSLAYTSGQTLEPGGKVAFERILVVAPRGDSAAIATELFFLAGGAPGGVEVEIAWGAVAAPATPARVLLRREGDAAALGFPEPKPLWLAVPKGGPFTAELPPGRWIGRLEADGATSQATPVVVEPGKASKLTLSATTAEAAAPVAPEAAPRD